MNKLAAAAILVGFLVYSTTSFSTDIIAPTFKRTTGTADHYLKQAELVSKLTHLRDVGGFTNHNAIACTSSLNYDDYLRAVWGEANFYPPKSECWRVNYNDRVKATGICANVGMTRDPNSLSKYSVLVCELTTDGWFSPPIWMKAEDVNINDAPRPK